MEVTLAVQAPAGGQVIRRGDGRRQATSTLPGTLWLCPIGVHEDDVRITEALPQILHIYLPEEHFAAVSAETNLAAGPASVAYAADVQDSLVREISYATLGELQAETAGGRLRMEELGFALAAHLARNHSGGRPADGAADSSRALDGPRLRRVLAYVHDNPENDLSVAELAAVACLSRFHFARAFRKAMGVPPHRYVSAQRLGRAQLLLSTTARSLADIALACGFSSQANFTRAFQRAVGRAPGEYRRLRTGSR